MMTPGPGGEGSMELPPTPPPEAQELPPEQTPPIDQASEPIAELAADTPVADGAESTTAQSDGEQVQPNEESDDTEGSEPEPEQPPTPEEQAEINQRKEEIFAKFEKYGFYGADDKEEKMAMDLDDLENELDSLYEIDPEAKAEARMELLNEAFPNADSDLLALLSVRDDISLEQLRAIGQLKLLSATEGDGGQGTDEQDQGEENQTEDGGEEAPSPEDKKTRRRKRLESLVSSVSQDLKKLMEDGDLDTFLDNFFGSPAWKGPSSSVESNLGNEDIGMNQVVEKFKVGGNYSAPVGAKILRTIFDKAQFNYGGIDFDKARRDPAIIQNAFAELRLRIQKDPQNWKKIQLGLSAAFTADQNRKLTFKDEVRDVFIEHMAYKAKEEFAIEASQA